MSWTLKYAYYFRPEKVGKRKDNHLNKVKEPQHVCMLEAEGHGEMVRLTVVL